MLSASYPGPSQHQEIAAPATQKSKGLQDCLDGLDAGAAIVVATASTASSGRTVRSDPVQPFSEKIYSWHARNVSVCNECGGSSRYSELWGFNGRGEAASWLSKEIDAPKERSVAGKFPARIWLLFRSYRAICEDELFIQGHPISKGSLLSYPWGIQARQCGAGTYPIGVWSWSRAEDIQRKDTSWHSTSSKWEWLSWDGFDVVGGQGCMCAPSGRTWTDVQMRTYIASGRGLRFSLSPESPCMNQDSVNSRVSWLFVFFGPPPNQQSQSRGLGFRLSLRDVEFLY